MSLPPEIAKLFRSRVSLKVFPAGSIFYQPIRTAADDFTLRRFFSVHWLPAGITQRKFELDKASPLYYGETKQGPHVYVPLTEKINYIGTELNPH